MIRVVTSNKHGDKQTPTPYIQGTKSTDDFPDPEPWHRPTRDIYHFRDVIKTLRVRTNAHRPSIPNRPNPTESL